LLAIVYDQTGAEYHRGRGLTIFVDGKRFASRADLGPLETALPAHGAKDSGE
jgi:hypothetical protein